MVNREAGGDAHLQQTRCVANVLGRYHIAVRPEGVNDSGVYNIRVISRRIE